MPSFTNGQNTYWLKTAPETVGCKGCAFNLVARDGAAECAFPDDAPGAGEFGDVCAPAGGIWVQQESEPVAVDREGKKHDQDKPRTDLFDNVFFLGVSRVLGFGARKYTANNWRKGIQISRLLGASLRHIFAFMHGEDLDSESGECHLFHAGCCLMFAARMWQDRPDMDDRYKA